MASLPLDPIYSHLLLLSIDKQYNCAEIILSIISILSIENMFHFKKEQKNNLLNILKRF